MIMLTAVIRVIITALNRSTYKPRGMIKDVTEDVVRKRYDEYLAKTAPLLDSYAGKGLVRSVNGVGSLDEVMARIKAAIGHK